MEKIKSIHIKLIILTILFTWTIVSLAIVFKNIVGDFTVKLVLGNIIFLLLFFTYLLVDSILKLRKLDLKDVKKRGIRFITFFVIILSIDIILYHFTKTKELNLNTIIPIAIGLSLGVSLFDLSFMMKVEN